MAGWRPPVGYNTADETTPITALAPDGYGSLCGLTASGSTTGQGTAFTLADAVPVYTTATPAFSPKAGDYTTAQIVTITDSTSHASMFYTTDGSHPTTTSARYSVPITVGSNETIKAIAIYPGYRQLDVAPATYTIEPRAAKPTFSLKSGTYIVTQTVTIGDATSGATIYYTTEGTTPTTTSLVYAATPTVSTSETIKALAVAADYPPSPFGEAIYTIQ
jgi:hypothetical protein